VKLAIRPSLRFANAGARGTTPALADGCDQTEHGVPHLTETPGGLLLAGLLLGAVVRLGLWFWFRDDQLHTADEGDYNTLALQLLKQGEYSFVPGSPTSIRPPLYPAFVAGIFAIAGAGNVAAVRFVQAAVSLLTVLLTYRLAGLIAPRRTAAWAAGMLCFYPSLLAYNNLILTEVLFTFLLTLSCLLTVLGLQRRSTGLFAATGVILGLAALTRSVVWLAPPFLAAFLLFVSCDRWAKRLAAAAALLSAFALTIAPWAVRNTKVQGTFVAIDVMGGRNFMMGNYRYTPLYRSWDAISIDGERSWIQEIRATYPDDMRTSQGKIDKLAMAQGLKFVRDNPGLTFKRSIVKFLDFWGLERELSAGAGRGFYGQIPKSAFLSLTVVIAGAYASAIFLALFGLVFSPPADRSVHWLLVCVIAYVCGMHAIVFGHSRYHLPLIPLVLIYAAGAVTHFRVIWAQRRSLRFGLTLCLCAVLLAGWTWNFVAVDWQLLAVALQSNT